MKNNIDFGLEDLSAIEGDNQNSKNQFKMQNTDTPSVKKMSNAPYVPTYYKKVRNYDKDASQATINGNMVDATEKNAMSKMSKKSHINAINIQGNSKQENRILPDSTHSRTNNRSMGNVSVVNNSYTRMNLDTDERVKINPTDPHDRNLFQESKLTYLHDDVNFLEGMHQTQFGDSLLSGFGPEFFKNEKLTSEFYVKKINEAKPYEVVTIDAEKVTLDSIRITAPVKFIGNGKTTLHIKNRILIEFREIETYEHMDGFEEEDIDFEEYVYKLKRNRVIFENLSIVWERKPSTRAVNDFSVKEEHTELTSKEHQLSKYQTQADTKRSLHTTTHDDINNPDLDGAYPLQASDTDFLFDLRVDAQVEFIDCMIKKNEKLDNTQFRHLKQLNTGDEMNIDATLDPVIYYAFSSSRLDSLSNFLFIRSSSFQGFSSLKSSVVKNLAVKYGYFTKFKLNVIQLLDDENLIFKNSMIMYNPSPGIIINVKNPGNQICIITHCNFDRNSGKGLIINSQNKVPQNELSIRIQVDDCNFGFNTETSIEIINMHAKELEIRDTEFAKNTAKCIEVKLSRNVQLAENNFKAIENDSICIKGSQVFMIKQLFYDCVNGIKVENLGLGNPKSPQIDILVDHCRFVKQFNTGIYLTGISLGCMNITSCNFERCSFGIYIEEFASYGNFSKYYDGNDINITNIRMGDMRCSGIAIRELTSTLRINQGSIVSQQKTPIIVEKYDSCIKKIIIAKNVDLKKQKIKKKPIKLMEFAELKEKQEAKERERLERQGAGGIPKDKNVLDFEEDRNSCTLI